MTQALSQAQLDQLETAVKTAEARVSAARARLDELVIRAPFAGKTGFRRVSLGGLVNPGSVITTLDDTSSIKLEFTVPQSFLRNLRPGLPVIASADGLGEQQFVGEVTAIDSRIDPISRAVSVRAELPNESGLLRPGLFMSVRLQAQAQPSILVPESALMREGEQWMVWRLQDAKVQRVAVQVGERDSRRGEYPVLSGLSAGEQVLRSPGRALVDGQAARLATPAQAPAANPGSTTTAVGR